MLERLAPVAAVLLVVLPVPAPAQDRSGCADAKDHHRAIKGCSEIIRKDPKDAIAYYMRGNALAKNGDLGQAIADYSKAIALNPRLVPAYNARATVYVTKGDYTRAVADVTRASELSSAKPAPAKAKAPDPPKATATSAKAPDPAKAKVSSDKASKPKVKQEEPFNPFREPPGG